MGERAVPFYGADDRRVKRVFWCHESWTYGFLVTFDGPARAIRCAVAIRRAMHALGLELRTGVHTGECELLGDRIAGIAVHTSARIAALAALSEVLVSATVRDLVSGSGIVFEDRGEHELKGVGERRIYAVAAA